MECLASDTILVICIFAGYFSSSNMMLVCKSWNLCVEPLVKKNFLKICTNPYWKSPSDAKRDCKFLKSPSYSALDSLGDIGEILKEPIGVIEKMIYFPETQNYAIVWGSCVGIFKFDRVSGCLKPQVCVRYGILLNCVDDNRSVSFSPKSNRFIQMDEDTGETLFIGPLKLDRGLITNSVSTKRFLVFVLSSDDHDILYFLNFEEKCLTTLEKSKVLFYRLKRCGDRIIVYSMKKGDCSVIQKFYVDEKGLLSNPVEIKSSFTLSPLSLNFIFVENTPFNIEPNPLSKEITIRNMDTNSIILKTTDRNIHFGGLQPNHDRESTPTICTWLYPCKNNHGVVIYSGSEISNTNRGPPRKQFWKDGILEKKSNISPEECLGFDFSKLKTKCHPHIPSRQIAITGLQFLYTPDGLFEIMPYRPYTLGDKPPQIKRHIPKETSWISTIAKKLSIKM